jgi:hypothetical protein
MADKQDNDEYRFSDLDSLSSDLQNEDETHSSVDEKAEFVRKRIENNELKRNLLVILIFLVVLFVIYKFLIGPYFVRQSCPPLCLRLPQCLPLL